MRAFLIEPGLFGKGVHTAVWGSGVRRKIWLGIEGFRVWGQDLGSRNRASLGIQGAAGSLLSRLA